MYKQQAKRSQKIADASQPTPYDLIKDGNCKTFKFRMSESYPNIKPPISKCCPDLTALWLSQSVECRDCDCLPESNQYDIVDVWKKYPNKDTLSYYGVQSNTYSPTADRFNQLISKCLEMVNPEKAEVKILKQPELTDQVQPYCGGPCGGYKLNRELLQSKIRTMPTVQKKLNPNNAFTWLHCPRRALSESPFIETTTEIPLESALDMMPPVEKVRHGLRRKYKYCELQCGISENKCTDYEWRKYKQDPKPYEEAFELEMAEFENDKKPEPRNYEELYSELIACFEKETLKDSLCKIYDKCCKRASECGLDGAHDRGYGDGGRRLTKETEGDTEGAGGGEGEEEGRGKRKSKGKGKHGAGGESPGRAKRKGKGRGKHGAGKKHGMGSSDDDNGEQVLNEPVQDDGMPKSGLQDNMSNIISGSQTDTENEKGAAGKEKRKRDKRTGLHKGKRSKNRRDLIRTCLRKGKKDEESEDKGTTKDCVCEICEFMKRRERDPDSPLIQQMMREEKKRQNRDYYKQMCHREYLQWREVVYPAPQHKCDPIVCDNSFACNPKLGEYCDCLDAMQQLQQLLSPKNRIVKNDLFYNLQYLKNRICQRLCDNL